MLESFAPLPASRCIAETWSYTRGRKDKVGKILEIERANCRGCPVRMIAKASRCLRHRPFVPILQRAAQFVGSEGDNDVMIE